MRVLGALFGVLLVAALSVPSTVIAGRPAGGDPLNAQLYAKASNGYTAELSSEGGKIKLSLSRGLFPALIYTFHGQVSTDGIEARIADLGNIDLRFLPAGKTKRIRPLQRCNGRLAKLTEGHFVGSFRFRAERGVAQIHLTHAKGWVAAPGWHCPHQSFNSFVESRPPGITYTFLQADENRQIGVTAFAGTDAEHPDPEAAEVSAAMLTRRGSVQVDHLAVVLGRRIFSFDSALTSATVTPPSPFHGSATYCASCAPGSRWTGDLKVSLPGVAGDVPLTGPGYETTLKRFQTGAGEGGGHHGLRVCPAGRHSPYEGRGPPTPGNSHRRSLASRLGS